MTTNDSNDAPHKVARAASARKSRTTARDIPRLLKDPLKLQRLRSDALYALTASSRSEGVLRILREDVAEQFKPGDRIVLTPVGEKPRPIRFVVECVTPPSGEPKKRQLHVRWVLISAAGKRSYLGDVLTEYLGLNVTLTSERDALPRDRVLMYDAESRRIRALQLKGGRPSFEAVPPAPPEEPEASSDSQRNVLKKTDAQAAPSSGGGQPLEWLMFERPLAGGRYDIDGEMFEMTCSWVGFSRCRFEIDHCDGPAMGQALRVGVPTEPLLRGLVWLDGRVALNTTDTAQNKSVIEVEWNDPPGMMPSGYRSLVAFCRMSTLKRLGDMEPQFIS